MRLFRRSLSRQDDILLVSQRYVVRFHADDASLRPMGRSTSV